MEPQQGAPDAFSMPLTLYCKHCPYRKSMNQTSTESTTASDPSHTFDPYCIGPLFKQPPVLRKRRESVHIR